MPVLEQIPELGERDGDNIWTLKGWQHLHGRLLKDSILMFSGTLFWPLEPRPEEIQFNDIAMGLSRENRFAGQSIFPYSVATHSVVLSQLVPKGWAKWALIHDTSEAYIKDLPRPVKRRPELSGYREAEAKLMAVVAERFNVTEPEGFVDSDIYISHVEMLVLFPSMGEAKLKAMDFKDEYIADCRNSNSHLIKQLSVDESYAAWIARYNELF